MNKQELDFECRLVIAKLELIAKKIRELEQVPNPIRAHDLRRVNKLLNDILEFMG